MALYRIITTDDVWRFVVVIAGLDNEWLACVVVERRKERHGYGLLLIKKLQEASGQNST
jgi:hypothetical protein